MEIKIFISTHKKYKMPKDSEMYIPIQVGADEVDERFGYQCDNTGHNISYKHRYYSDVSTMFWAWQNVNADYYGFCHYRRYFGTNHQKETNDPDFKYILSRKEAEKLLDKHPVVVAPKRHYVIESVENHFNYVHNPIYIQTLRSVIKEMYPNYLNAFNKTMSGTSAHLKNTFIMRGDYLNSFFNFAFPVLFEFERRINDSIDSVSRICGKMMEFLLDTWIITNDIQYKEQKLILIEKRNVWYRIKRFILFRIFPSRRPKW